MRNRARRERDDSPSVIDARSTSTSSSSLSSLHEDTPGTTTLAGINLPAMLEPAMKHVRKSSDDLLALVNAEREKVKQSIMSAAAAAAASPFAPVSLDDFGGEAWREFRGNWSAVAVGFGNGKGNASQATPAKNGVVVGGRWKRNRRSSTSTSTSASSSARKQQQQQQPVPPQFGMDVFSALNDSLRASSSFRGSGSASRIKSKALDPDAHRSTSAAASLLAMASAQASEARRAARAAAAALEETADTVAGNWSSLGAALARGAQDAIGSASASLDSSGGSGQQQEKSFAWPSSTAFTTMIATGVDGEKILADLPAPLAAAVRAALPRRSGAIGKGTATEAREATATEAAAAAAAATAREEASNDSKEEEERKRQREPLRWPLLFPSPALPRKGPSSSSSPPPQPLLAAGDGPLQREAAKRRKATSSSLREPGRRIAIFTTASLPWMTGTAVNPLLRAAYLAADASPPPSSSSSSPSSTTSSSTTKSSGVPREVTLFVPWLPRSDQDAVFPPGGARFDTPAQQEAWVRRWARERTGLACDFKLGFYAARYAPEKGSILPVGDITECVDKLDGRVPEKKRKKKKKKKKKRVFGSSSSAAVDADAADSDESTTTNNNNIIADVAVLEEPEHLTWYHHGARWADKFTHVVGVVHTNYLDYASREEGGALKAAVLRLLNGALVRAHTHKVVKLSDAVQPLPRSVTEFVHGVPQAFLEVGRAKGRAVRRAHGLRDEGDEGEGEGEGAATGGKGKSGSGHDASSSPRLQLPPQLQLPPISLPWQQRRRSIDGTSSSSSSPPPPASDAFGRGAYFIGKALWAKGYTELLDLLEADAKQRAEEEEKRKKKGKKKGGSGVVGGVPFLGDVSSLLLGIDGVEGGEEEGGAARGVVSSSPAAAPPPRRRRRLLRRPGGGGGGGGGGDGENSSPSSSSSTPAPTTTSISDAVSVDCFGAGPDLDELRASASSRKIPVAFHGAADHLSQRLHDYRVLVNPSTSDVVATTTAEALAMGKWVLVADLPCNAFFKARFRNCLTYKTPKEFSRGLRKALTHDPHPVSDEEAAALSWEAATQRFLDACSLHPGERAPPESLSAAADRAIYSAHNALTAIEPLREAAGAGRGTRDAPESLEEWRPEQEVGSGGILDRKK